MILKNTLPIMVAAIFLLTACGGGGASNTSTSSGRTITAVTTISPGRLLAAQCAQCHGTDGASTTDIDTLAGENRDKIIEELLEMQSETNNEVMHLQAKGYTNEQITLIADYFASLPASSTGDDQ